jgi:quercetin dioxygenase-like cupin family protein
MARRWALLAAVLLVVMVGTGARGTPPEEHEQGPLARSTVSDPFVIETTEASDVVMEHVTIPAGAAGAWHTHPGPTLLAVKSGALTIYDAGPEGCTNHTYTAGQGFFEPAGGVHLARNEGAEAAEIYVTHIVAPGGNVTDPAESPGGDCPA